MDTQTDNLALAQALWPNAQWTTPLLALWRERLSGLDQVIVTEAIKTIKPKFSSHQPELKWVLERYAELYEQAHPSWSPQAKQNGSSTFHVSWQATSKHGVPNAWYGRRCATRGEADALARSMGGSVRPIDIADDPFSEIEARQETDRAREIITQMPREQVTSIVTRLRSIGFCSQQLPGRVSDWPRMAVLAVYAEHLNQQERRK